MRALKRLIQEQVETPLSLRLMKGSIQPGQDIFLCVDPNSKRKLTVLAKPLAKKKQPAQQAKEEQKEEPLPQPKSQNEEVSESASADGIGVE